MTSHLIFHLYSAVAGRYGIERESSQGSMAGTAAQRLGGPVPRGVHG